MKKTITFAFQDHEKLINTGRVDEDETPLGDVPVKVGLAEMLVDKANEALPDGWLVSSIALSRVRRTATSDPYLQVQVGLMDSSTKPSLDEVKGLLKMARKDGGLFEEFAVRGTWKSGTQVEFLQKLCDAANDELDKRERGGVKLISFKFNGKKNGKAEIMLRPGGYRRMALSRLHDNVNVDWVHPDWERSVNEY